MNETIEQNLSKTIKSGTDIEFITFIETYLNNLPTSSLNTEFFRNTDKQIAIFETDPYADTYRTRV